MTKLKCFVLIFSGFFILTSAQTRKDLKVTEVFDEGLLKLSNESVVKLADISIPSQNHPHPGLKEIGKQAIAVLENLLLFTKIEITEYTDVDSITNVTINIKRNFYSVDPTEKLLKSGLARLTKIEVSDLRKRYERAESNASQHGRGVWDIEELNSFKFEVTEKELIEQKEEQLKYKAEYLKSVGVPKIQPARVIGEMLIAPVGMTVGLIGGGVLAIPFASSHGHGHGLYIPDEVGVGMLIGSVWGISTSIYLIAKAEDPNLSYGKTLLVTAGGAVAGTIISTIINGGNKHKNGYYAIPLCALVSTMLYVNAFSPSLDMPAITPEERMFLENYEKTHQALIDRKKIFDLNLVRIEF